MTLRGLIDGVEIGNEAAAKLNARKAYPEHAPDMGRAYNGSLDAAKRLHDALLPGWAWMMGNKGTATVIPPEHVFAKRGTVGPTCRVDDNPARAWLLAILRALDDQREGGE